MKILVVAGLLALLLAGCAAEGPVNNTAPPARMQDVLLCYSKPVWYDEAKIETAAIDGDVLELYVRFGGGCALHEFNLVACPERGSIVVRADLVHDANRDECMAYLASTLRFDLTLLRNRLRVIAPGREAIIEVREPAGSYHAERYGPVLGRTIALRYRFR